MGTKPKKKMAFLAYVKMYATGKDSFQWCAEYDFCRDANLDSDFKDHKSWKTLKSYLENAGACDNAIEAAQNVFNYWEKTHGKN